MGRRDLEHGGKALLGARIELSYSSHKTRESNKSAVCLSTVTNLGDPCETVKCKSVPRPTSGNRALAICGSSFQGRHRRPSSGYTHTTWKVIAHHRERRETRRK